MRFHFQDNIHQYPIDLKHPHQGVIVQTARQGPVWVKLVNLEHPADCRQFRRPATLADAEPGVDVAQTHVWRLALVVQKVHPANGADDAACPRVRAAAENW